MNTSPHSQRIPPHVPPELVIDFDATHDPALSQDLFGRLAEVRDSSPPVAFSPYNGGHWLVFDRQLIRQVLTTPEIFSSAHISAGSVARGGPKMIPLGMDPPEHNSWRLVLMKHFGPARVKALEQVIRDKADELVASLDGQTRCDFVKAVAEPMPISIFMALMGLPYERFPEFRELAITVLSASDPSAEPPAHVVAANGRIMAILGELIASRSQSPGDDLVSALLRETVNGQPIGGPELMSICFVLFLGGLDTVTNAMSFGMRHLASNPALQDEVRQHPERIPELVERLLKLSAFVNTNRLVKVDTELGGAGMKAGDVIWNISWAGSNDADDDNDLTHLAFGGGPHMCAGMHLARMELRTLYEAWFRLRGPFALVPDPQPAMRGGPIMEIKRLLLDLQPAGAANARGEGRPVIRVIFVSEDGAERTLETPAAGTLMTLAVANAIPGMTAECGGAMACGTCQVFIAPEWADRLGAPSPLEQCLLEVSLTPGPNGRLACQIPLTEQLDGLKVQVAGPAR